MNFADPLHDHIGMVCLLKNSGNDIDIVNAARISYNKHSEEMADFETKLIQKLFKLGHRSPFEHSFLHFHIKCPIFVARQWMRHRIGVSYNELSLRRTKSELEFYIPLNIINDSEKAIPYKTAINSMRACYIRLLQTGVKTEDARFVLPLCTYTEFFFSCNLASFFHFLDLRDHPDAQWEIRRYAEEMKKIVAEYYPISVWCYDNHKQCF
jgi:thymidylate synthase (FAD)